MYELYESGLAVEDSAAKIDETLDDIELFQNQIDIITTTSGYEEDGVVTEITAQLLLSDPDSELDCSMEELGDKLRDISSKVIPTLKKGLETSYDMMADHYHRLTDSIEMLDRTIVDMETEVNAVDGDTVGDTVKLRREAVTLSLGHALPKDTASMVGGLDTLTETVSYITNEWMPQVKETGKKLLMVSKKHDKDSPKDTILAMNEVAASLDFGKAADKLKATTTMSKRFKKIDVFGGPDIPGSYTVFVFRPELKIEKDDTALEIANRLRSRNIKMMRTFSKDRKTASEVEISTPTIRDLKNLIDACKRLQVVLEKYHTSGIMRSCENIGKQINSQFDKQYAIIGNRENVSYNNAAFYYATAYLKWVNRPSINLTTQALAAIRASLVVCKRSLTNYK